MDAARHIRLEGFTRADRNEMIARVSNAIQAGGADLIDHQMFSNAAININFEVVGRNLARLGSALSATGISFDEQCLVAMGKGTDEDEIIVGSLHLTFIHSEPDLRIHVPSIPG